MGTANGRVVDLNTGLGIAGTIVSAAGPSHQTNTTDTNGYYTISEIAPGPYAISTLASGYLSQTYELFIRETANPPLPDFRLHLLSIRGRVYDSSIPGVGIAEANVTINGHFVFTNSTGYYEALDLSDGQLTIAATAPGYTNETQQVTVSAGTTAIADFGLDQVAPGTISGTVTDSSTTQALSQAIVRVSSGSFEKSAVADPNGEYSIESVPAWPYWTVDAYEIGYVSQSTTAEVEPSSSLTLDFELTPFGIINGTVKDQDTDQPIAGALVKADSAFQGTTDSTGHYTMFALADRYTVAASAPGYASESQSNVRVTEGDTTTLDFIISTIPTGSIVGNVTDTETGTGIAGASVTVNGHTNTTDTNGDYILSNLPSWTYNVTAAAAGYSSDTTTRTVPSGGSVTANFALPPYTRIHLGPYSNTGDPGESFSLNIDISEARFVDAWEVYLWWNPAILEASDVSEGDFLKGPYGNRTTALSCETYPGEGVIHIEELSTLGTPDSGVSGNGTLATIVFQIKAKRASNIDLTSGLLFNPTGFPIFPRAIEGAVFVVVHGNVNRGGGMQEFKYEHPI